MVKVWGMLYQVVLAYKEVRILNCVISYIHIQIFQDIATGIRIKVTSMAS